MRASSSACEPPGRRGIVLAFLAWALALLSGCTASPPEILFPEATLFLISDPGSSGVVESLRLFVSVRDGDGSDDIGAVYVQHEETELYWEFDPATWVSAEYGGDDWVGLVDIRMPDGEPLPRGRFRVIVEDKSLQRDDAPFSVTAPGRESVELPRLEMRDSGPFVVFNADVVVRVFTRAGQLAAGRSVGPGPIPREFIDRLPKESGLQAFLVADLGDGVSALSGPYILPR